MRELIFVLRTKFIGKKITLSAQRDFYYNQIFRFGEKSPLNFGKTEH
jgi:hypothetical protein